MKLVSTLVIAVFILQGCLSGHHPVSSTGDLRTAVEVSRSGKGNRNEKDEKSSGRTFQRLGFVLGFVTGAVIAYSVRYEAAKEECRKDVDGICLAELEAVLAGIGGGIGGGIVGFILGRGVDEILKE